jgi:hypothetical protein
VDDGVEHPLESIHSVMVFSPADHSLNERDAWVYGIVVGWDDALGTVAKDHGWDKETVERLQRLHEKYQALMESA